MNRGQYEHLLSSPWNGAQWFIHQIDSRVLQAHVHVLCKRDWNILAEFFKLVRVQILVQGHTFRIVERKRNIHEMCQGFLNVKDFPNHFGQPNSEIAIIPVLRLKYWVM